MDRAKVQPFATAHILQARRQGCEGAAEEWSGGPA